MLARASAAAYRDSEQAIARELACDTVVTFTSGAVFGYVAHRGQDLFLAFRGTASPLDEWERSIKQWIANLDFHQVVAHGGRVHRGFHEALDAIWEQVGDPVRGHVGSNFRLWITGHSLGGALAILAGARLHEEGVAISGIYTFGAPSIGDSGFATSYQPALHRVENSCDAVCHLPPPYLLTHWMSKLFGTLKIPEDAHYESVGTLTMLNQSGRYRTAKSACDQVDMWRLRLVDMAIAAGTDLPAFLDDHRIASYVTRLAQGESVQTSPFVEIPIRVLKAVLKFRRNGSTLLDAAGRIVGFLQETGLLREAIRKGPAANILNAANIAKDGQLNPMSSALSTLQLLGGVNLAASLVGIGVSVAGFAIVLNRLENLQVIADEARREAVAARLAAERADVQTVIRNKANTLTCLGLAEAAWAYSDPVSVWKDLQIPMLLQLKYEQCLIGNGVASSIFHDRRFSFEEAMESYESVLLLDAAFFQTLLLQGEEKAAVQYGQQFVDWHDASICQLPPGDIASARSRHVATTSERDLRLESIRKAKEFKGMALEIHRHLRQRIELIRYLLEKGIRGRDFIEDSRQRMDIPLVVLPVG